MVIVKQVVSFISEIQFENVPELMKFFCSIAFVALSLFSNGKISFVSAQNSSIQDLQVLEPVMELVSTDGITANLRQLSVDSSDIFLTARDNVGYFCSFKNLNLLFPGWTSIVQRVNWISASNRKDNQNKYQVMLKDLGSPFFRQVNSAAKADLWKLSDSITGNSLSTAFGTTAVVTRDGGLETNASLPYNQEEIKPNQWESLSKDKGRFEQVTVGKGAMYVIKMKEKTKFIVKHLLPLVKEDEPEEIAFSYGGIWSLEVSKEDGTLLAVTDYHPQTNYGGDLLLSQDEGKSWMKLKTVHVADNQNEIIVVKYAVPVNRNLFFVIDSKNRLFRGTLTQ